MENLGVSGECAHDVKVAVTEACTNVLKHATGEDEYEVVTRLSGERAEIRIKDKGGGFDHPQADVDGFVNLSEEGGRGIILMRALVDEVEFTFEPEEGTVVRLVKCIELESDSLLRRFNRPNSPSAVR